MRIIGAFVMIAAAIYGAINILNGTYRRTNRPVRMMRTWSLIIVILIAVIFSLLSGRSLKW